MKDFVRDGWKEVSLGDVCDIYQPKTISAKQMVPNGPYPVFGANGVIGRYTEYNHEEPQLLVTCRGATCGSVNISDPFSWVTGNAMVVRPKIADLSLRYVEYFFRGAVDLEGVITGAAQPQITRTSLAPVRIPLPPLEEQQQIVAVLDEAFEGLARARAHAEANLQNARELFASYVTGLFWDNDWPQTTLNQISENLDRVRVPITKADRVAGDIPYYGASGVVDHVADFLFDDDLLLISEDGANLLARTYPIAFSISGKAWVNNHAHVLRFPDINTQEFVRLFLNSISLEPYVSGMAQPKLNQAQLNRIPIPFPDAEARKKTVVIAKELSTETGRLEAEYQLRLADLDDLRQSLMQKAFAGELT